MKGESVDNEWIISGHGKRNSQSDEKMFELLSVAGFLPRFARVSGASFSRGISSHFLHPSIFGQRIVFFFLLPNPNGGGACYTDGGPTKKNLNEKCWRSPVMVNMPTKRPMFRPASITSSSLPPSCFRPKKVGHFLMRLFFILLLNLNVAPVAVHSSREFGWRIYSGYSPRHHLQTKVIR